MLAVSTPQEQGGQPHDLFETQWLFDEIGTLLKKAGIKLQDLFLNADPVFDSAGFRLACAKEDIIANVKPNHLAFWVIFLRKIKRKSKV